MLEREKGCSPTSALMRFYLLFRLPVLWSAADCLHVIHCIFVIYQISATLYS